MMMAKRRGGMARGMMGGNLPSVYTVVQYSIGCVSVEGVYI